MSPPAKTAIRNPANAGPRMRDRFHAAVLNAMALNINGSPTISGMNAVRAGMESASSVPFRNPTQMKSQNETLPVMTMTAMKSVATPFSAWP